MWAPHLSVSGSVEGTSVFLVEEGPAPELSRTRVMWSEGKHASTRDVDAKHPSLSLAYGIIKF